MSEVSKLTYARKTADNRTGWCLLYYFPPIFPFPPPAYFCTMHISCLIVGQGISGTWLSYFLQKENQSFLVIDDHAPHASSRLSAGIINPVTGRRHVAVWMADELLPYVRNIYTTLGQELNIHAISQKDIIDFFPNPQMRLSFEQRVNEDNQYVSLKENENQFHHSFQYDFGFGKIAPCYTVHLQNILPAWRSRLKKNNQLLEEKFNIADLKIHKHQVNYKNITADKIIFCDGNAGTTNPWFRLLPFAPNKGEALILEIPDLPPTHIYKKGMVLVPLATPHLWWLGASYQWSFTHELPTDAFKTQAESTLKNFLKLPYKIVDHICGIRPATLERRPFVGLHPVHSQIGILNGMGTKGCSLAPYFANQLTQHLVHHTPILPDADIKRFSSLLTRNA